MDNKIFDSKLITLDGKMDEPVWNEVPTYTDFTNIKRRGGELRDKNCQTYFKVLPCEDRIFIGVKCMEPDMEMANRHINIHSGYAKPSVEFRFCPTGIDFDIYQFYAGRDGSKIELFYSECGVIQPDPYAPEWRFEMYTGEDHWSLEAEIPLTAFYMTRDEQWSDTWLMNVARVHCYDGDKYEYSTWSPANSGFGDSKLYRSMSGFPIRPKEDDVCISKVSVELENETANGYEGIMTVAAYTAVDTDFVFKTEHTEPLDISLKAGSNEFTLPCSFAETGKIYEPVSLTRTSDGKEFKRTYPVRALYEPLVVKMTLPEYRNNFYPGQDYSKVVGKIISKKQATVTLEGPGIESKTVTPNAEGNFSFETPNFEIGEAWLTASIDGFTVKKKIRRLAPTGRTMTWVSGGNIVCDGEPVLPRKMYGVGWRGGKAFNDLYETEPQYNTPKFKRQHHYHMGPYNLVPGAEDTGGEATMDGMPSEEMLRGIDKVVEANKDEDFAFYYLSDEPDLRILSPVYLKNLYEYLADKDPYHVIMMCLREPLAYVECCDWMQTHPYIQPFVTPDGKRTYSRPFHQVGRHLECIAELNRPDKCIGYMPTCYAYRKHSKFFDFPTFEESYAHNWAGMMHGGKSMWPYSYREMRDRASMYYGMQYLFSTFEVLEDIMLFGKREPLYYSETGEAMLYTYGDEKMFVLASYSQQEQTITLDGIEGTAWYNFRREGMIEGNTFHLKPFETIIGTTKPRGEDLPKYHDVIAQVEKEEYIRLHNGSLLFDRMDEMTFTTSNCRYLDEIKLFDGTLDNLAVELTPNKVNPDVFFEVGLSKIAPTFQKIVVCGHQVDDVVIKVRNGETLTTPEVTEVTKEQYKTTILLKDTVTPDALRLEFGSHYVELYEIQVF